MKAKVLFIDSNHSILHETLEKAGIQCDLNYHWTEAEIASNIHLYDGIVIRSRIRLGKELIDKGTKLRFIARAGAGMENIDVAYAESKGVRCLHSPEGNKDAVAEHAIGMLLSLFNNLCRANLEVRESKWIREGNRGVELMGKTVGIIGYGNTGMAFAERLKGFDVQVLAVDKYKKGFTDEYAAESSLEEVFAKADVLSLHLPLTAETQYYANAAFFGKFQKSIYLLNTSRGKVLNTADLAECLQNGKIKGACLDVLEYETLSFEKLDKEKLPDAFRYLSQSPNVMLSPHIAGWTQESNVKIARVLAEKIVKLVA
ncbi:MAG TPA: NAD(P)-dependent oxidoreductase [Bacteroidia bacterium]|jgi:D-3-phosphoglycerate dehydrogenase|nr:NAD(P)-dependent oxidoreductase [Bacteroidia bacterium]